MLRCSTKQLENIGVPEELAGLFDRLNKLSQKKNDE